MKENMMDFKMEIEIRPCLVSLNGTERKALFHLFNYLDGAAVVELEDGQCTTVAPWAVKFVDNKISEYCFG
jgi:hypothetical protein